MRTWTFPEAHPSMDGPWSDEPDKAQWVDGATDLDCLIVRNHYGALCGYVGVPSGHPLHGVDYETAYERAEIDVHGGLTYAATCQDGKEKDWGICHVPEAGRPADVWWLGFDCAHAGDLIPKMDLFSNAYGVYRNIAYVQAECAKLAEQIHAATSVQ